MMMMMISIMIPFVNFNNVVANTTVLFVRQGNVCHQKNMLLHEAGISCSLVLCLYLLISRNLEDNCFNSLCYRYSVTKDGSNSLYIVQPSNTTSNIYLIINDWATNFGH